MICESCNERKATVHLTEIVNDTKKEIHLCEECAQAKGVAIKTQIEGLEIPEFFGQLAESHSQEAPGAGTDDEVRCEVCGLTFEAFRNIGKFGCPNDFVSFKQALLGLLDRIHGSTQHRDKVPSRTTDRIAQQKELRQLREELKQAVACEAYERAVELRDRVHTLEAELGCVPQGREPDSAAHREEEGRGPAVEELEND
jgi:protein arginine kinase activator